MTMMQHSSQRLHNMPEAGGVHTTQELCLRQPKWRQMPCLQFQSGMRLTFGEQSLWPTLSAMSLDQLMLDSIVMYINVVARQSCTHPFQSST